VREAGASSLALKDLNQLIASSGGSDEGSAAARGAGASGSVVYLHLALEKWTSGL